MILCICALICWIIIVFFTCALLHRKQIKNFTSFKRLLLCCFFLSGIFLFSTQEYVSKYRTFAD